MYRSMCFISFLFRSRYITHLCRDPTHAPHIPPRDCSVRAVWVHWKKSSCATKRTESALCAVLPPPGAIFHTSDRRRQRLRPGCLMNSTTRQLVRLPSEVRASVLHRRRPKPFPTTVAVERFFFILLTRVLSLVPRIPQ